MMSRTYQATGINLQGMAFGEADRLLTILTAEYGLIRAIAPGARKYKSSLRGRSELYQKVLENELGRARYLLLLMIVGTWQILKRFFLLPDQLFSVACTVITWAAVSVIFPKSNPQHSSG